MNLIIKIYIEDTELKGWANYYFPKIWDSDSLQTNPRITVPEECTATIATW